MRVSTDCGVSFSDGRLSRSVVVNNNEQVVETNDKADYAAAIAVL